MLMYLWIALGSAIGGMGRYWLSGWVARSFGETFPFGTLLINISGSFLIGLLGGVTGPEGRFLISAEARQFVLVGVLGGYTTFSSFSYQTLNLARDSEWLYAIGNILLSVALSLLAVWIGHALGQNINQGRTL